MSGPNLYPQSEIHLALHDQGIDPLRDDTLEIAKRWAQSAPVEMYMLPSSPHGFIHFPTAIAQGVLAYSRKWISARVEAVGSPQTPAAAPSH